MGDLQDSGVHLPQFNQLAADSDKRSQELCVATEVQVCWGRTFKGKKLVPIGTHCFYIVKFGQICISLIYMCLNCINM